MKIPPFLNSFLLVCAAAIGFAASHAQAQNVPAWTFLVPISGLTNTYSTLSSVTSDAAGNTLLIIEHGNGSYPSSGGSQIFLLNSHGVQLGGGDYPTMNLIGVLSVSAKKVLITVGLGGPVMQGAFDSNGMLVFTKLPFQTAGETSVFSPPPSDFGRKYMHSTVSASNLISEVRRYALAKLKP